ncbi:MAG: DUF4276 family protein [Candidatus Electrothrix sp. Rat3]|nr:DUF4276 family protein [Candidatus Electrothrix rattekaaiensis]
MVDITIYVEGAGKINDPTALTVDNSVIFRENFHKLFSQQLSPLEFNLMIRPFGTVTQAKKRLEYIENQGINAVLLIDLDAPKGKREERRQYYEPFDTKKIFFMIQEMEAWILSQIDKIEEFGKSEGLIRKKGDQDINDNPLLKEKNPEQIRKPSEKLDTIFRQYFDVVKIRGNKERKRGKRYSKTKDGPRLIGLLKLSSLMECFDEARRLIGYIERKNGNKYETR